MQQTSAAMAHFYHHSATAPFTQFPYYPPSAFSSQPARTRKRRLDDDANSAEPRSKRHETDSDVSVDASCLIRAPSPTGSDMSMTDALDLQADSDINDIDEDNSDTNADTDSVSDTSYSLTPIQMITPVLPIPTMKQRLLELCQHQHREESRQKLLSRRATTAAFDDDSGEADHDPSKQLVLYQPIIAPSVTQTTMSASPSSSAYHWGDVPMQ